MQSCGIVANARNICTPPARRRRAELLQNYQRYLHASGAPKACGIIAKLPAIYAKLRNSCKRPQYLQNLRNYCKTTRDIFKIRGNCCKRPQYLHASGAPKACGIIAKRPRYLHASGAPKARGIIAKLPAISAKLAKILQNYPQYLQNSRKYCKTRENIAKLPAISAKLAE